VVAWAPALLAKIKRIQRVAHRPKYFKKLLFILIFLLALSVFFDLSGSLAFPVQNIAAECHGYPTRSQVNEFSCSDNAISARL
jgi:hypothetical protein